MRSGSGGTTPEWHSLDVESVRSTLDTSLTDGLTDDEAARRLLVYGANVVSDDSGRRIWPLLVRQLRGPLIAILVIAAGVSLAIGEALEAVAIAAIVFVNALLGFAQEYRAERAIEELRAMFVQHARVRRSGRWRIIDAAGLVPGDVVELEAGDRVPGDARVVDASALRVDESALTGESSAVWKTPEAIAAGADVAERTSVVHLGTSVRAGRGRCVVTATGSATMFGTVVDLTRTAERDEIPLQRSLAALGRRLGLAAVLIAAVTVVLGLLAGREGGEMLLTGVSLAVAVVPEGLPAVVTVTLALGVRTMSQRRALLRQLEAAETLGAATVICTDKTGTLTENQMRVTHLWTSEGLEDVDALAAAAGASSAVLAELLETAQVCNNAAMSVTGGRTETVGDPTEVALLTLASRLGAPEPETESMREVPFDSATKIMTVVARSDDAVVAHVKGAPEVVLGRCTSVLGPGGVVVFDESFRADAEAAVEAMTGTGLRVLAVASRRMPTIEAPVDNDLVLLGLVGMHDPPRAEVPAAVASAAAAGITVIMMTGDAADTALAIARQIGLPAGSALTGTELELLDDGEASRCLDGSHVLARVTPAHKMRIVRLLQGRGEVVAMTGDGVNDAPALQQASVGIAMGERGTDVARGAADVVLTDDNFASIVSAIEEGRRQYANIAKFVAYLLSANLGEVIAVSGTVALGWPLILLPAQILWMNLVTDGVVALALGVERAEPDVMARAPRRRDEPILTHVRLWWIGSLGVLIGVVSILVFKLSLGSGEGDDLARAQTLAFTAMVLLETANVLNFRSERESLASIGAFTNRWLVAAMAASVAFQVAAVHAPGLGRGLGTIGLSWGDWLLLGALSVPVVVTAELAKSWLRQRAQP